MKPAVFVGSSTESRNIAYAVQEELAEDAEVTVWSQGIFKLSSTILDDLLETLDKSDFGIFIFSLDDLVKIRDQEFSSTRDNVVFELGLFIGRLGKQRNFFILPKDHNDFRIPTDLMGITPGTFDSNRLDKNIQAALGPACNKIRSAINKLGVVKRTPVIRDNVPEQPDNSYYHIRVQRLITGNRNPSDPKYAFNQSKNSFTAIAMKLFNGQKVQIAGDTTSGFEINHGIVSIIILRSKEQVATSQLKGSDPTAREEYWNELQYSENVVDITAELHITDIYAK